MCVQGATAQQALAGGMRTCSGACGQDTTKGGGRRNTHGLHASFLTLRGSLPACPTLLPAGAAADGAAEREQARVSELVGAPLGRLLEQKEQEFEERCARCFSKGRAQEMGAHHAPGAQG